jgi:hypothetical protein
MQTLIRIVVALAVLLLVLVGVSYLFPGTYRVERAVEIDAAAPAVFARVGDLRQWASWTAWHERDPEMKMTYSEISVGQGAWQKWDGPKSGTGELTVTLHEPPSRMGYDLYFPDFDMRSAGEIAILPAEAGGGVRVVWSDQGALGLNPVNRWFGLFMDKMIGADFEAGLERLKQLSETPAAR